MIIQRKKRDITLPALEHKFRQMDSPPTITKRTSPKTHLLRLFSGGVPEGVGPTFLGQALLRLQFLGLLLRFGLSGSNVGSLSQGEKVTYEINKNTLGTKRWAESNKRERRAGGNPETLPVCIQTYMFVKTLSAPIPNFFHYITLLSNRCLTKKQKRPTTAYDMISGTGSPHLPIQTDQTDSPIKT